MSIFKDYADDVSGYRFRYKVKETVKPSTWLRLHKWRKQRANRGWSDRDTWGLGDHLAKITAEMLQHLLDYGVCDWPEWFKLNVQEKGHGAYTSLEQVINDINQYLDFIETTWADGLDTKRDSVDEIFKKREDGMYEYIGCDYYEGQKKLSKADIKHRINKHHKEWEKRYAKAQKAMQWVGRNFAGLWD